MKFSRQLFGHELAQKLKKEPFDSLEIAKWCRSIYVEHLRELDDQIRALVVDLSTMADDPQFAYSKNELGFISKQLLSDRKMIDSSIKSAIVLEADWLACPECMEAWQEKSEDALVLCPKCKAILCNPK